MDSKYFIAFALILFLSLNVFAAAPTLSAITASPVYATDHNYGNWKPTNMITLSTLVTGADLNKDGCGYAINGSWSYPTAIDLNLDTNILSYSINTIITDDINWGLSCTNTSGETGYSFRTIYLDANAPTTTSTVTTSNKTMTITGSDKPTNTGNGSGVKRIYYKIDSSAWASSTSNPLTITPATGENHTIYYYAVDNLDNNGGVTVINSRTFYTGTIQNQACGLINLITLLFAALIVLTIMILGMTGNIDEKVIIGLVITAILGVICIIILASFITPFCGLP
jgi:hypothetical protein